MIGENKDCKYSKKFVKKGLFKRTRGEVTRRTTRNSCPQSTVKKDVAVECLYNYINIKIKKIFVFFKHFL